MAFTTQTTASKVEPGRQQEGQARAAPVISQNFLYRVLEDLGDRGRKAFRALARILVRASLQEPAASTPIHSRERARDARRAALRASQLLELLVGHLQNWDDAEVERIGNALTGRWEEMVSDRWFDLDLEDVAGWIGAHAGDEPDQRAEAVEACIRLRPPAEVRILKRMPQTGAQKVVFDATWQTSEVGTPVVVKKLLGEAERLLRRELLPHPLAMAHPNIVEVHKLTNRFEEPFLVERKFPVVLSDSAYSEGSTEAATLMADIARALAFLHSQFLVHGDIKPDNIAFDEGRYILLDFGICRPETQVLAASGTGSLRTRAPEALVNEISIPLAIDIWGLGATVFNMVVRRFPLLDPGERVPRVWEPDRAEFEQELARRAGQWDKWIDVSHVGHRPLREIVAAALEREPANRPSADELLGRCLRDLEALIGDRGAPVFPADVEHEQLQRVLSTDTNDLQVIPERRQKDLLATLRVIDRAQRLQRRHVHIGRALSILLSELQSEASAAETELLAKAQQAASKVAERTPQEEVSDELLSALMHRVNERREAAAEPTPTDELAILREATNTRTARLLADEEVSALVDELEQFYNRRA